LLLRIIGLMKVNVCSSLLPVGHGAIPGQRSSVHWSETLQCSPQRGAVSHWTRFRPTEREVPSTEKSWCHAHRLSTTGHRDSMRAAQPDAAGEWWGCRPCSGQPRRVSWCYRHAAKQFSSARCSSTEKGRHNATAVNDTVKDKKLSYCKRRLTIQAFEQMIFASLVGELITSKLSTYRCCWT